MRVIRGLGALVALAVLLVGVPAGLIVFAGNPIPTVDELVRVATGPDYGGQFLMGSVLPIVAWALWASFAVGFLVEAIARIGRVRVPKIPGLRFQQKSAGALIGAVVAMVAIGAPGAAMAAEPVTSHSSTPAAVVASVDSTVAPASTETEAEAEAATPSAPTHEVKDGESLWRIAEATLGSGERWTEIAQLNYGKQQPDGHSLTREHWLNAGWVLTLPADAAQPAAVQAAEKAQAEERVVQPGDTLWGIAEEELGDGARYTEIAEASPQVQNPDVILPGWTVTIPGTQAAEAVPAPAAVEEAPEAAPAPQDAPAADTVAPEAAEDAPAATEAEEAPAAGDAVEPAPAPVQEADVAGDEDEAGMDWVDEIFNVRTAGGIGAVAAAGLLSVLGIRRMKQHRQRKPGQRIAMPQGDAATMELELRAVENPMGMEDVDHALRHLAVWAQDTGNPLPPLYALRLSEAEIALYLDAATELPEPFVPVSDDHTSWTIDPELLPPLEREPSAPYPALVTVGQDHVNAHLMVDLEHIGALNIIGDEDLVDGALNALAVELATAQWGEALRITLVGVAPGLPAALDTGRVRHVDDVDALMLDLRAQAADTERTLAELGVSSIEEARSIGAEAEAWLPEIVLLGQLPDEQTQAELAELVSRVPRVGIAAVSSGQLAGEWVLDITSRDEAGLTLPAAGAAIPVSPQMVDQQELAKILALFATTTAPAEDGPLSAVFEREVELDELPDVESAVDDSAADVDAEEQTPTAVVDTAAAEISETDLADVDDQVDAAEEEQLQETEQDTVDQPAAEAVDETADADDEEWKSVLSSVLPRIHVPDVATEPTAPAESVEPADTAAAVQQQPSAAASADETDEVVFRPIVHLHGTPYVQLLGNVEIHGARGPEPRTAKTSHVARATELIAFLSLQETPGTLTSVHEALWPKVKVQSARLNQYVSRARGWLGANNDGELYLPKVGTSGYRLHPDVRSDWSIWRELVGDDPTKADTADLIQAMHLVKGRPFSGVSTRYYKWVSEGGYQNDMLYAIVDAAHELATRSLRAGDARTARLAARVGCLVMPENEISWRNAMKAEHLAGSMDGFERIVQLHEATLDDGDEPEDETQELITAIRNRRAIAS